MTEGTSSDESTQQLGISRAARSLCLRGVELQRWAAVCASSAPVEQQWGADTRKFKQESWTTGATGLSRFQAMA